MTTETFWTWEKEEKPAREAFEVRYHEIMKRAKKGQVYMREAYEFHVTERRFSCEYPAVLETVAKNYTWWKKSLIELVKRGRFEKTELMDIQRLCGGMKHYEFFEWLYRFALQSKYPTTWEAEEAKEKERIKKATELGKKRLGL